MPRSHRPRKRYVPKRVDFDHVETAIALATKLSAQQQAELGVPAQAALTALRAGTGPGSGWPAWCGMADALNVAEQLALAGIASDRLPEFRAAQEALHALHARHAERGSWTLRGPELSALVLAVELHQVQLRFCTQGEVGAAILAVQRIVSQARAGNASPRTMVCMGELGGMNAMPATGRPATTTAAQVAAPTGAST